jgi:hypothetical protein
VPRRAEEAQHERLRAEHGAVDHRVGDSDDGVVTAEVEQIAMEEDDLGVRLGLGMVEPATLEGGTGIGRSHPFEPQRPGHADELPDLDPATGSHRFGELVFVVGEVVERARPR